MNNISTLRFSLRTVISPCLFAFAFVFSFVGNGWGQTELISPTGDGGFETGSTFAANGWTALNNNNLRGWFCGTGQSGYSGARSAFIGTSSTNVGSNTAASVAHLYKSITIPSGATNIQLSFKYKQATVDNTYDYLKVTLLSSIPTSGTLPTTDLITTIDPTSAITTYTTQNATISNTYAGSTRFLVFSFKADAASPVCYGAIDDISLVYSILTPCTGAPNPGNTLATSNQVVSGSSTVLSLQNATTGSGVSYQWKSSSDNITYSPISGATSPSYSATPNSATYYVCDVTCSGVTTTSNSLQVNLTYCTPNVTSSSSYYITGVSFTGGISDFSNTNTGPGLVSSYSNYSASVSCSQFATASVNFNISLAGNSTSNSLSYGVAIWVDWNNNYSFETSERMYNSNGYIYSSTGTFTIPSATPLGNYRMRVVADYNATSPAACTFSSGNGEVEDYTLTVVAQPTCMVPTNLASSLISYQSSNISWTAPTTGTAPANYEYEIRTSGAAGSGATGLVTSGTVSTNSVSISGLIGGTTYTYYVRSSCGSGDFSFWVSSSFTTLACSSLPTGVSAGSITSNSATITWVAAASGSPSGYEYEIRTSGAAGSGATGLVASAQTTSPTVSAAITGLSPATTYSIYVRTVCYSGFTSTWTSAVTFNSGCSSPTGLAASANSTSQTFTSISGTFTVASSNVPTGYIVVRSLSSTPPSSPASGSALPSVGNNVLFGNGYVVDYIGTSAGSWNSINLSNATTYNFYIFSYNNSNCTGGPIYSSSSTFFSQSTLTCPIFASTIAINGSTAVPGNSYPTLTAAIADIKFCGITQATILELTTGYSATSETYPIVLSSIPGSNSTNTITIREASNISGINITSSNTTATIDINSGQNWIIDGRPGGVGNRDLTIGNTNATNSIRFINEATSNTIKYCNVNSNVTSLTSGLITFSTTSGANGNDNNTIDNCDLNGGGTTANIIYSSGTNTTAETNNSGVVISNNNIRDFYSTTGDANGVLISAGNTDWTISGNSFYWGASRQGIASSKFSGILITNSNGNNFNIVGNFIGGTAPSCGGTALTINGTATTYRFRGISLNVGAVIGSSVQNNTISNISWITSSGASALPGIATGIFLGAGNANIGNNTGNIISNFSVQSSSSGGVSCGIGSEAASSVVNISNNSISGIITTGTSSTVSHSFVGIQTTAGTTITINNNTIGSTTNLNSINASTAFTGTAAQLVTGIANSSSATSLSITNNVIANLNNAYVPSTFNSTANSIVCGISSSGGTSTINGNLIRNLYSSANATNSGLKAAVVGISATLNAGSTISQNTIYALKSSNTTNTTISVTGIAFSAASTGSNIIEKNVIYNLSNVSPTSGKIHGIFVVAGNSNLRNNMVSLGLDDVGSEISIPLSIYGFYELAGTNNFFHNSVCISGSNVTSNTTIPSTAAFYSYASTATRSVQNNIFVNARSNSATSGGPKNYAIYFPSSGVGGTCNYNVYQATGQGAVFGSIAGGDKANFAAWQLYSPTLDPNSLYLSPTFTSSTDLHLNPAGNCSLDNKGTFVASVTTDIDGATRSNSTPDMGADEFTYSGTTATWIGNTSNSPSTITNWSGGVLPTTCSNILIQSGSTYYPSYSTLTIDAGTTYTVQPGSQLTVTGILTNNGTLTIESGATFLQGTSLAGTGTYNVKQFVTGAGGATPTGRFWYMGVPVNNLSRSTAFGTASGSNRLWSWSESGQAWSSQLVDATALTPTTGYSFRSGSDVTLNFSGTSLYSADPSISGLTNTTGSFSGCHLMSNPFTAYADWEQIYTASTNISSTYCVRSFNTANSQMVYDTYNATGDVAVQNGSYAVTRYIAPMQSFWIIVDPSTTGTFNMTKAMLSHQPSATGLKDLSTFNAFARLNLIGGNLSDQVVVYMTPDATNAMDEFDSKKMMLSNVPQVYTTVGDKKLVINGLKESKAHTIVPLTLELPTSQSYHFEMAESNVNYGLVILEDREELVFQDMTANPDYAFFAQAGISSDRFVLHFHFPLNTASTDEIGSSAQIDIVSNNTGAVNVHLSDDLQVGGEITVLDQAGRLVAKKTITQAQTLVQINETAGVYFVRVQTPGKTEMKKVVLY